MERCKATVAGAWLQLPLRYQAAAAALASLFVAPSGWQSGEASQWATGAPN
jgi:hypothetical protein